MSEPRQIGEILEDILAELRVQNAREGEKEARMRPDNCGEILLSIQDAASLCNVTRQSINNWIRKGKLHKVSHMGRTGVIQSELLKITTL